MNTNTMSQIEPIAERICSLESAINFKLAASVQFEQAGETYNAQKRLNDADTLRIEQRELFVQARNICRAAGVSLPGLTGLRRLGR